MHGLITQWVRSLFIIQTQLEFFERLGISLIPGSKSYVYSENETLKYYLNMYLSNTDHNVVTEVLHFASQLKPIVTKTSGYYWNILVTFIWCFIVPKPFSHAEKKKRKMKGKKRKREGRERWKEEGRNEREDGRKEEKEERK